MSESGFKRARQLTDKGFHYDNLLEMASHCREETDPERILSAYILNRVLSDLAAELGDGIVLTNELRKLEAKYRTALNLALECAEAGSPQEEQTRRLADLVTLLWTVEAPEQTSG
jgi:hypothetical protein